MQNTYSILPIVKKRIGSRRAMVMLRLTVDRRAEISIRGSGSWKMGSWNKPNEG